MRRPSLSFSACLIYIPLVITRRARRSIAFTVVPLCVVLATGPVPLSAFAERTKWWQDRDIQQQLDLSRRQIDALERTFQKDLLERIALRRSLDRLEVEQQRLLDSGQFDNQAIELISRVEETRAKRNVLRTLMLFRMHQVLTPQQRSTLARIAAASGWLSRK